jgi:hypothetical protein
VLDPVADRRLIAAAKLVIATKVEMGGIDGAAIKLQRDLKDASSEELLRIAAGAP